MPLRELADIQLANGASFIYRQDNSRFIGVQYSVEGRDLAGAVQEAQRKVAAAVPMPAGYRVVWGGEYEEYTASRAQLQFILPVTLTLIFVILFALYNNFKFPFITVVGVVLSAPIGGLLALELTGTPFSVSSGIGFLALFGVSVQTAIVYISYVNELRRTGKSIADATSRGGAAAAPADHDDRARRRVRPAAGRAVERGRVGLAAAVRARDRRWAVLAAADQRLPDACAVCRGGAAWRSARSLELVAPCWGVASALRNAEYAGALRARRNAHPRSGSDEDLRVHLAGLAPMTSTLASARDDNRCRSG